MPKKSAVNFITIDFEDWYQGLTSTACTKKDWHALIPCIEEGSEWLLRTLDEKNTKVTFFIVGHCAAAYPELVRRIADSGHEIGLHGYMHSRLDAMKREQFREDLMRSMEIVGRITGKQPRGFRAPWFSINTSTEWVWDVMAECGIYFDSSVFPIRTPLYGMPFAPRHPYIVNTRNGQVNEFPISTLRLCGLNLPFSGGFYFRTLPYILVKGITRLTNDSGIAVIFYFHPWEFVPHHQKPACVTFRERLSHYHGLTSSRNKFARLLDDFEFDLLGNHTISDL